MIVSALLASGRPTPARAQSAPHLPVDALVLVGADNIAAMDNAADFIKARGGQVFVTFAPHAMLVKFPPDGEHAWLGQAGIEHIITGQADITQIEQNYDVQATMAALGWNHWLNTAANLPLDLQLPLGSDLVNDNLPALDNPSGNEGEVGSPPADNYTSEFLYGRIQVDIFLVESELITTDLPPENWLTYQRDQVVSEITAGLAWWAAAAIQGGQPSANLSFNLTFHTPFNEPAVVKTTYEPITRPHTDQKLWMGQIMSNLGYTDYYFTAVRQYVHSRRVATGRDWGFAIFVVNSLLDLDGYFSDSYFAYSYIYGPFTVMTYDNDGWGIDRMEVVTAHETGHIFGAMDEYASSNCSDTAKSGYLGVANTNCENGDPATEQSIMRSASSQQIAYPANLASTPARGQVGWRDSDNDGLYDVVDTEVSVTAAQVQTSVGGPSVQFTGLVNDVPYDSPTRPDISINTISQVEYRLDGGSWLAASATNGSFDESIENFTLTTSPLSSGQHNIQIRGRNSVGNYSPLFSQSITIAAPQEEAPPNVSASPGLYTDRVSLTWSTVAGATSYEIYRSTVNSFATATKIATVSAPPYNDTSATPEQTYYYWVIAISPSGHSEPSDPATGRRELAVPAGVTASDGTYTDRIRITWNVVSEATGYSIYRAATSAGTKLLLGSTGSDFYFDDFSVTAKTTYYYFVTADNSYGSSDYSAPDTGYLIPLSRIYLPLVIR